jgi:predicted CxxxxCH...CXXCH cytochrome family protein
VVDAERHIVAPELHVDGIVEHAVPSCTACHGSNDDPAPPVDTHGNVAVSSVGVGAHRAHLRENALGRPLACTECHQVPEPTDASHHVEGLAATVTFSAIATSGGHDAARFDPTTQTCADTWCHGAASSGHGESPAWTSPASLSCTSCHETPPAAPHPQLTDCALCHGAVVTMNGAKATITTPSLHVDGHVDLALKESCTGCHGDVNAAPPRDTAGRTSTSAPGVGAHQTHVLGTSRARAVRCDECHTVPDHVLASGHVDSALPAEVRLTGTASAFGGAPVYAAGSCRDTSCHGAVFPDGNASGGTNPSPTWTKVDGTEAVCGSCHGLPPPAPHPYVALNPVCSKCHADIAPDNRTFVRPELHVDGLVTFELP